jgi:hypothetical protein
MMPAYARRTDPETSHAAAASIGEDSLRASQAAVLAVLRTHGPLVDVELDEMYDQMRIDGWPIPEQSPSGLRTRRRELVDLGFVIDTGERGMLESGRRAILWRAATDAEREAATDPTLF